MRTYVEINRKTGKIRHILTLTDVQALDKLERGVLLHRWPKPKEGVL